MKNQNESQTQIETKESVKEEYQPKEEFSCEVHDKECTKRMIQSFSDCV
jgi:hypothetical protein